MTVAAGVGQVLDHPLEQSPFTLPEHAGLESALESLLQAVFNDVDFSASTHSENLFTWEVRV